MKTKTDLSGVVIGTISGSREYTVTPNAFGAPAKVKLGNDVDVTQTFDAAGRVVSRVDAVSGVEETFAYADVLGRLTSHSRTFPSPAGPQTLTETRSYNDDSAQRTTTATTTRTISTPLGAARTETSMQVFSVRGLLLSATEDVTQLSGAAVTATTRFTYDAKGRLLAVQLPEGGSRSSTWDAMGARLSSTDEAGNTFEFTSDALGLDSTVTGPLGFQQSTTFDAAGRLVSRTDNGATWTYSYDEPGWVKETLPVTNMTVRRRYNGRGQLVETDESGGKRTTTLEYDGDVIKESTTREGTWELTTTQLVDGRGRVRNLHEVWNAGSGAPSYDYTTHIAWVGRVATTSYDWKFNGQPVPSPTESATYDGLGQLTRHTIGDVTDAWDYDGAGALARFTSADAPARTRLYGTDGRLKREAFDTELTEFGYTLRGDVAAVRTPDGRTTTTQYEYAQGAGRALPTRVTVSRGNESTATATAYDALGHATSVTEGVGTTDAATTTYVYGPRGELQSVELPTSARWTYSYDKLLRLSAVTPPTGSKQKAQHYEAYD
ncbi:MAG: hypothetical protein ACO1OB_09605, partial [Archangium sp.]